MRTAFTILGALLITASAVQMATASEHHPRGARSHDRSDHRRNYQPLNEPSGTAPSAQGSYYGKPPPSETRTCDRYWCYAD
jgi:hypothetical protein